MLAMLTEEEHQKRREGWFLQLCIRSCDCYTDPPEWPTVADIQSNPEAARARFYAWYDATQRAEPAEEKKKQAKQPKPRHHWVDVGADKFIFAWFKYYGTPLPPSPEEGNEADLVRAVKKI